MLHPTSNKLMIKQLKNREKTKQKLGVKDTEKKREFAF